MAVRGNGCLTAEDLDRISGGAPIGAGESAHLEECPRCRGRLAEAEQDNQFLGRIRASAVDALAPEGAPRMPGYRVLERLSAGAQGVVYRAVQEATSRVVAIKVLGAVPETEGGSSRERRRAEREAEIAARLHHPNVVDIYESRTIADGHIAMVMEFVDGVPLHEWNPPGQTDAERTSALLRVFIAICNGVHHAHLNGVIHRDLKPENVLVTPDGRPVVLDFGVARADGLHTTRTGEFAGTPAYASPEQVSGRPDNIDALTDVYSLGVILYRLLTGTMPYELHGSLFDIARTITEVAPVPVRARIPSIPHDLEAITLRALRKHRADRYQSAAGMALDIDRYLRGAPVEARSGSGWYVLRKAVAMNRGRVAWIAALIALASGAAIVVALSLAGAAEAERRAEEQRDQARAVAEFMREILPSTSDAPDITARDAANAGLQRLYYLLEAGEFAETPGVDQALRRIWGDIYSSVSDVAASMVVPYAEVSLRSGLVRLREHHGRAHPDIASTLHSLASILRVRGRLVEAESICREALEMRVAMFGPDSLEVARSRMLLAEVLADADRGPEALAHSEAATAFFRRSPDVATADLGLAHASELHARVLLDRDDRARAAEFVHDAFLRRMHHLAPDEPDLVNLLGQAASLLEDAPDAPMSVAITTVYAPLGPDIVGSVLADVHLLQNSPAWSRTGHAGPSRIDALMRIIEVERSVLPIDDPVLVKPLLVLMTTGEHEQRFDVQSDAALEAVRILEKHYGPSDRRTLACLNSASTALIFGGESARAVDVIRRAIAIHESIPPVARDPLMVANSRRVYAWALALSGDIDAAIPAYRAASEALGRILPPDHYVVALADAGLAYCLSEQGRIEEAESLSARALDHISRTGTPSPDQHAHICFCRAHVLCAQGRFAEALPLLDAAWDAFYGHLPRVAWSIVSVRDAIAAAGAIGDTEREAVWRSRQTPLSERASTSSQAE